MRTTSGERARLALEVGVDMDVEPRSELAVDEGLRPIIRRGRVTLEVTPQPPAPVEPEGWVRTAIAMRTAEPPVSWRQIAARVGQPQTTVRRALAKHLTPAGT